MSATASAPKPLQAPPGGEAVALRNVVSVEENRGPVLMFWVFHVLRDYAGTLRDAGSDPNLENWRGFAIDMDATNTLWADFPTVGLGPAIIMHLFFASIMPKCSAVRRFRRLSTAGSCG